MQLRIEKMEGHEKLVSALNTLDGKKLETHTQKEADGNLLITLRDPRLNIPPDQRGVMPLITHKRLTSYCSENKIKLISISWGNRHHRGAPFGARLAATAVAGN